MDIFKYKKKLLSLQLLKKITFFTILNLSFLLYFSTTWFKSNYNNITVETIISNVFYNKTIEINITSFIKNTITPTIILSILLFIIHTKIEKNILKNKNLILSIKKFTFKNIITLLERKKDYILSIIIFKLQILIIIKRKIILIFIQSIYIILIIKCLTYFIKILKLKEYIMKTLPIFNIL